MNGTARPPAGDRDRLAAMLLGRRDDVLALRRLDGYAVACEVRPEWWDDSADEVDVAVAGALCSDCEAQALCRAYAAHALDGVHGGLRAAATVERRRQQRERQASRRARLRALRQQSPPDAASA